MVSAYPKKFLQKHEIHFRTEIGKFTVDGTIELERSQGTKFTIEFKEKKYIKRIYKLEENRKYIIYYFKAQ